MRFAGPLVFDMHNSQPAALNTNLMNLRQAKALSLVKLTLILSSTKQEKSTPWRWQNLLIGAMSLSMIKVAGPVIQKQDG